VVAALLDASVAQRIARSPSQGRLATARTLRAFGEAPVIAGLSGGLAVAGWVGRRPALVRVAGQTATAILLETVATQAAKHLVGRARPYQDQDRDGFDFSPFSSQGAFPSGHTAAAFALATTVGDASGSRWARAALYSLATGTAWARIAEEKHWVSDVVAGAAVGILSARVANGRTRVLGLQAPRPLRGGVGWQVPF
jgi:membrane-associated phospholipid phosphatase